MNIDELTRSSSSPLGCPGRQRGKLVSLQLYSMLSQVGGQLSGSGAAIWDPSTPERQEGAELKVEDVTGVEKWRIGRRRIEQNEPATLEPRVWYRKRAFS